MPRVLFISYCFPPMGGVSVQRVTKFVKYLPMHGWDCSVLTVLDPAEAQMDPSLLAEIPENTIVRRAKSYEPGQAVKSAVSAATDAPPSLSGRCLGMVKGVARRVATTILQPDAQILWRPHALREGMKLLKEIPHDAIVATGPPFSSLLLGATLSKRSSLPLVLDYRDEWGISNAYWENRQTGMLTNALQMRMQVGALKQAACVVATTPSSAASLEEILRKHGGSARACCIYNGFDSADSPTEHEIEPKADGSVFRLSFIGSLWNLNPVEPFAAGVQLFANKEPELAAKLEIVFAGKRTAAQEAALVQLERLPVRLTKLPFVSHDRALQLMAGSDALLMLNADKPGTHRIINAKTFEYMAARRPMLVVAPSGDVWDVVRDLPGTKLCEPRQPKAIAEALSVMVREFLNGRRYQANEWEIDRFERRNIAGELANVLSEVAGREGGVVSGVAGAKSETVAVT